MTSQPMFNPHKPSRHRGILCRSTLAHMGILFLVSITFYTHTLLWSQNKESGPEEITDKPETLIYYQKALLYSSESILPPEEIEQLETLKMPPRPRLPKLKPPKLKRTKPKPKKLKKPEKKRKLKTRRDVFIVSAGILRNELLGAQSPQGEFSGTALFSYEGIGERKYHLFRLRSGISLSAYENAGTNFFLPSPDPPYQTFNMNFDSLFKVYHKKIFTLYTGLSLEGNLNLWNTLTPHGTRRFHIHSWTASATTGLGLLAQLAWKGNNFRVRYSLPVIGGFSHSFLSETSDSSSGTYNRPDFFNVLMRSILFSSSLFSWKKMLYTSLDVTYELEMTKWMAFVFIYGLKLEYLWTPQQSLEPDVFTQQIHLGLSFFW